MHTKQKESQRKLGENLNLSKTGLPRNMYMNSQHTTNEDRLASEPINFRKSRFPPASTYTYSPHPTFLNVTRFLSTANLSAENFFSFRISRSHHPQVATICHACVKHLGSMERSLEVKEEKSSSREWTLLRVFSNLHRANLTGTSTNPARLHRTIQLAQHQNAFSQFSWAQPPGTVILEEKAGGGGGWLKPWMDRQCPYYIARR